MFPNNILGLNIFEAVKVMRKEFIHKIEKDKELAELGDYELFFNLVDKMGLRLEFTKNGGIKSVDSNSMKFYVFRAENKLLKVKIDE
jgi:hypothetical protein